MIPTSVHILLVEDDEIDAEAVTRSFQKEKIANPITWAKDGMEALEYLRGQNNRSKIPRPYLLLVDINMPKLNGIEFVRELRKDPELKSSIVFLLTTSKRDEDKLSAYDLNVAGYMVKSELGDNFLKMTKMLDHYWKIVEFPES